MYAFVRFLEDNVCYALPVSCVRDFSPRSRLDFDNQKVYAVYRGPEELGAEPESPSRAPRDWGALLLHKAQILALAEGSYDILVLSEPSLNRIRKTQTPGTRGPLWPGDREDKSDLENSVMQKKIKIPKLSLSHIEEDGEVKDYGEEDLQLRHIKRPEGRKSNEVAHKSIEAVVARLEKQNGLSLGHGTCPEEVFMEASPGMEDMDSLEDAVVPRALYEELLRNYQQQQEEMRHLQQELERTRRQLVQQAKKLKEYGALVSEMKELRDLNRRLQDVLLLRLGSGPAIDLEKVKSECLDPEPELRSTFSEEANTSSYYPAPAPVMDKYILDNGKVHLGSGIWVDEEKWHQLQVTQGDSKYTKNLAVMIWGTDVLKNRSVTGVATKKKKDAIPKPPLSPHKLSIVRECLYDRIAQETVDETEIAQRLSKVNKYICEKIMDINKSCKNEERREAKYNLQ
ncbi:BEN domain-containing protein 5 isoform X1 [Erinaceus europaeus]|uniref:BEN domain-containing protein 5 isoform X1 n=2 Tax=Erinaceus europaeus TaxID=9365 RepID=A0ABM3YLF8_ERIEU|nr:BEN domain-containing protein 5 isoform X1 [Erinaceus europaeus]